MKWETESVRQVGGAVEGVGWAEQGCEAKQEGGPWSGANVMGTRPSSWSAVHCGRCTENWECRNWVGDERNTYEREN